MLCLWSPRGLCRDLVAAVLGALICAPASTLASEYGPIPGVLLVTLSDAAARKLDASLLSRGRTGEASLDARLDLLSATRLEPVYPASIGSASEARRDFDRVFRLRYAAPIEPSAAAATLQGDGLALVEADGYCHAADVIPNDPLFPTQWSHRNTNLGFSPDCDTDDDSAWNYTTGSPAVTIAVLDSGIDLAHPEFAGRLLPGYDFTNGDSDPSDDFGHGTCCAGIAAARGGNGQGIAGVAWDVAILPIKVLDSTGHGSWSALAAGIVFAADNGAKLLSISLGGATPPSNLWNAVNYAVGEKGCLLVAASGNGNVNGLEYPAAYANVVGVGACSPCNQRKNPQSCDGEEWWGSNYGSDLDFVAPGVLINTTDITGAPGYTTGDYFGAFDGTSAATPHVAGIAALLWSVRPDLTASEIWNILRSSAEDLAPPGFDIETGWGRVNAANALESLIFSDATPAAFADTSHVAGVVWGDFDLDDDPDLFLTRDGGQTDQLLRNDGGTFVDATEGPLADPGEGQGAAAADYDNDGDLDLYIGNNGPNRLLRNDRPGFTDVTTGLLGEEFWTSGVSWCDTDLDGDVDLFMCSVDDVDHLLRNDGAGWTSIESTAINNPLSTYGAAWGDFDNDGDSDVYVCNDGPNRLLRNYGGNSFGGATPAPLNDAASSRGCAWGDFDNDGDLDLAVANFDAPNRLFRNDGTLGFVDVSPPAFAFVSPSLSVAWGDYDLDGDLDLFVTRDNLPNLLLRNESGYWTVSQKSGLLANVGHGRGSAWADYDRDGDLDLFVANADQRSLLVRNDRWPSANWFELRLTGVLANRSAIGARVRIKAGGTWQLREITAGSNFLSMNDPLVHFGVGQASQVDSLVIRWPRGGTQVLAGLAVNQSLALEQPAATSVTPASSGAAEIALDRPWPNPTRVETSLGFRIPVAGRASIKIFAADGRLVRTLLDEVLGGGSHVVAWDGRDGAGHPLASGSYFIRLDHAGRSKSRKMVLLD